MVLSIMGILFTAGYASLRDFSNRQAVDNSASSIQGDLKLAQEMALSSQLPSDSNCTGSYTLNGYNFKILTSGPIPAASYEIRASCSGPGVVSAIKTVKLPVGETIGPVSTTILFKILGQGTNIASGNVVITVTQTGTGSTASVTVASGGQIQ